MLKRKSIIVTGLAVSAIALVACGDVAEPAEDTSVDVPVELSGPDEQALDPHEVLCRILLRGQARCNGKPSCAAVWASFVADNHCGGPPPADLCPCSSAPQGSPLTREKCPLPSGSPSGSLALCDLGANVCAYGFASDPTPDPPTENPAICDACRRKYGLTCGAL